MAILARGGEPVEIRRGLPGDPGDDQSRYLEAAVDGVVVGCLYLPNGNPQPGPKFDYKLAWFERLIEHAADAGGRPGTRWCWRATTTWCPPTSTSTTRAPGCKDALLQPESRDVLRSACWRRAGSTRIRHLHPGRARSTPSGTTSASTGSATPGLRIDHLLLNRAAGAAPARGRRGHLGARPGARPATTRRPGSSWTCSRWTASAGAYAPS